LPDKSGDCSIQKSKPQEKPYPDDFERFWQAYPTDKNMPKKPALRAWRRLTPEKREAAIAAIPGFRAYCRANDWYRPIYAERFLSQEKFEGYGGASAERRTASRISPEEHEAQRRAMEAAYGPEAAERYP
jgi:hypothetical protein